MDHEETFTFYTEQRLVALTGLSVKSLKELLALLRTVPGSSIFYHTHQTYLSRHFETPVFSNDFALWVSEALQEEALGERLAAIDLLSFTSIRALRDAIIATVEREPIPDMRLFRECPEGDELHFCRSKSFAMSTGLVAHDPVEFFELLPQVTTSSLFFHFFEARLRLGRSTNDFSFWLRGRGATAVADRIDAMDPYIKTLDEFKQDIIEVGKRLA